MTTDKREIKFRFWLGHTKKMTYDHSLAEIGKIIPEFTDDIIPLQYTGLKDKNGKEIYEGDIINYVQHGGYNMDSFISPVMWDENNASFGYRHKFALGEYVIPFSSHDELFHDVLKYTEVIGNIYEHNHLLKNAKA